jgi:small subunit ribosomal protein S20
LGRQDPRKNRKPETVRRNMPNTKSAKKRLRQDAVRKDRNLAIKREMRNQVRKVREAVKARNVEQAETEFRLVAKKLDRAGARHLLHRNAAARIKSRLSAAIKAIKQG